MTGRLTVAMIDALMDELDSPWYCIAGYRHEPKTLCFHPLTPIARRMLKEQARGLRARLEGRTLDGTDGRP